MNRRELSAEKFRFGPFEADTRSRELRKNGLRIKLRDKSFEILATLLERPGEVVTRSELRCRLWPAGTFVDFENSLNSAMNRLRNALGEGPGRLRYVETVPRVGYRFVALVEQVSITRPKLAVLPFESLSRDAENEVFAEAVTEALITQLGNVGALRVISRQSVLHLKGTQKTAPQIANELKVDAIVEGSVLHASGRIRTTAQLIQADPEQHLWANAYECELGDLLTTQGQIAQAIAEAIRVTLTSAEIVRLGRARPVNPEAHVAYLMGRHHIGRWSRESLQKALEYFQLAIQKDPGHALAYAHMSECYAGLGYWGHMPFKEAYEKSKEAALKALSLDDGLSNAHWALAGATWWHDWDLAACEAETLRAIELNPSDERAHETYAFFLIWARDDREGALSEIRLALDLDPLSQRVNCSAAWIYMFVHDYERAIEQARKTLELFPNSLQSYYVMGLAEMCRSRYAEAIAALERAVAISPDALSMAYLGSALARAGRIDVALPLLRDLLLRTEREYVLPRCFVFLYAAMGQRDLAFEWLERAYDTRDPGLFTLRAMPLYDPLRSDPRFDQMLERVARDGIKHSAATQEPTLAQSAWL